MKRILTTLLFVILLFIPLVVSAEELNTEQLEVQEIKTPEPFIIDTDFSSDIDDALAISTAMYFQDMNMIDVKGVALCCTSTRGAYAMSSLLAQHKYWDIPIACDVNVGIPIGSKYHLGMTEFPHNEVYYADVVNFYRILLASSPSKVNIVVTGQLVNIDALLKSQPDVHSPLNGHDLIAEKVNTIYFVGCKSNGQLENNIFYGGSGDVPNQYYNNTKVAECAKNVVDNAPCRIVFTEADIVGGFSVGGFFEKTDKSCTDILTRALRDYGTIWGSASFDPFGVFIAVMDSNGLLENYMLELQQGTMRINLNGTSYFTLGEPTRNHYRVEKLVNDGFYRSEIDKCLAYEYKKRSGKEIVW